MTVRAVSGLAVLLALLIAAPAVVLSGSVVKTSVPALPGVMLNAELVAPVRPVAPDANV